MFISHTAIYVDDLEAMKRFYEEYFGGVSNSLYHNPKTGLKTYFLTFEGGCRLEIMTRPGISQKPKDARGNETGFAHTAFSAGSREKVDGLTSRLESDGYTVVSGPRVTGDGCYESCILDPEGNRVEITE